MTEFRIGVDLSGMIPPNAAFDAQHFPMLQEAVRAMAEAGRARWLAYANGAPLPSGNSVPGYHRKGYAASISLRQIGDFEAEIISDYRGAEAIDQGEPARDLKRMLDTSNKVGTFRDGRRYLIIPFRWTAPGNTRFTGGSNEMRHDVRHWWKGKTRSVAREGHETEWGSRFTKKAAQGLGLDTDTPGKDRNQVGMHAFRSPKARGGAASNARFMTFRTMHSGSDGWIVPEKPALHVTETIAEQIREDAEGVFREAAAADLGRLMAAAGPRPGGGGAIRRIPGR